MPGIPILSFLMVTILVSSQSVTGTPETKTTSVQKPTSPNSATARQPKLQVGSLAEKQLFSGKVVLLRDAFERRGIRANREIDNQVVLETPGGELIPIIPDWRGLAFVQDKRMRNRKVEPIRMHPNTKASRISWCP